MAGIVGCGKTTAVNESLDRLSRRYTVFRFTGDDILFRQAVTKNSRFILDQIKATTQGAALVFVDEVQKTEDVFDALKLCFDNGISFIVSGSNPEYLSTTCRKRLQRRAEFIRLFPLSLPEILQQNGLLSADECRSHFLNILDQQTQIAVPNLGMSLTGALSDACRSYLERGGLPLAHLAPSRVEAMQQVRLVIERGFDLMSHNNLNISDTVRTYLAAAHSREFAYQGLFQKTGLRSRDTINTTIDELTNHGYLVSKRPVFPGENRRSYLVVYSYIDPGMISYFTGSSELAGDDFGARVEGVIHTRLENLKQFIPLKTHLSYYKPYTVDQNDKTKFLPGEVDFIYERSKRLIPIEVKFTSEVSRIDSSITEQFVKKYKSPYGVVLYGGVPHVNLEKKLIYWPYWLV